MRITWVPDVANVTVVACDSQYAPFCHPQPFKLVPVESVARFTSRALVELIGYAGEPAALASENCTHTASFDLLSFSARRRSQTVYGVAEGAVNVAST